MTDPQRHDQAVVFCFPEALEKLAPPCDPAPIPLVEASRIMLRHFRGMGLVKAMIDRHPDPYRARI